MIRTRAERIADTLAAIDRERDCWVATGRPGGDAHLIPLSFCWDGERLVIATLANSLTAKALHRTGRVRVSLPSTFDVVIIDATVTIVPDDRIDAAIHRQFCMEAGFDPCAEAEAYIFALLAPQRIQAWRDVHELEGRVIMEGGVWLSDDPESSGRPPAPARYGKGLSC